MSARESLEAIKEACETTMKKGKRLEPGALRATIANLESVARRGLRLYSEEEDEPLCGEIRDAMELIWETAALTQREAYERKHDPNLDDLARERAQGMCDEARFVLSFIRQHPILYRWLIERTGEHGVTVTGNGTVALKPGWPLHIPFGITGESDIQIETEEADSHRFVAMRLTQAKGGRQRILIPPSAAKGLAAALMMAAYGDEP